MRRSSCGEWLWPNCINFFIQSFYLKFSEGELGKIGLFFLYPECIDVQNGLQQTGAILELIFHFRVKLLSKSIAKLGT